MNSNLKDKVPVELDIKQEDSPPSPTFGTKPSKPPLPSLQGMQKVGKHGQSQHEYLKVMNKHEPPKQYRKITKQQLAKHTSEQSAWLSLEGVVYDVTIYLNYHPGGDILLKGCGKQCDQLFFHYHSWVNGKRLLEKYKIGYL